MPNHRLDVACAQGWWWFIKHITLSYTHTVHADNQKLTNVDNGWSSYSVFTQVMTRWKLAF